MLAQADLSKLATPITPDPPTCGGGQGKGNGDSKEDSDARRAVLLFKLLAVFVTWLSCRTPVVLGATFACCQRDAAQARVLEVLDRVGVILAPLLRVQRLKTGNEDALVVGVKLVVVVATDCVSSESGIRNTFFLTIHNLDECKCSSPCGIAAVA